MKPWVVIAGSALLASCATLGPAHATHPGACHIHAGRPDPACTPGAADPRVTQAVIGSTICVRGWTATIRPPVQVTAPIKTERMTAYGFKGKPRGRYELDHLLPLELGGASSVANLWPEPLTGRLGALMKDRVENAGRAAVCAQKITLTDARTEMIHDWVAFGRALGVLH